MWAVWYGPWTHASCLTLVPHVARHLQSAADVRHIRKVLNDAGGYHVKIISKIENEAGLVHYDSILAESDGIMVARGDLAMEIPSEKVRQRHFKLLRPSLPP